MPLSRVVSRGRGKSQGKYVLPVMSKKSDMRGTAIEQRQIVYTGIDALLTSRQEEESTSESVDGPNGRSSEEEVQSREPKRRTECGNLGESRLDEDGTAVVRDDVDSAELLCE